MLRPVAILARSVLAGALALATLAPARAQQQSVVLELPGGAAITASALSPATSYRLLTGPWTTAGGAAQDLEGARNDTAWRLRGNQDTSLQILAPLRAQIADAGFRLIFDCATETCGGFDFRYALDLLPEPEMHVDLGDFRYLAARRGADWLALTVSRSSESGFVQLTTLRARDVTPAQPQSALPAPERAPDIAPSAFAVSIEAEGRVALDDLTFESGKTALGGREFASLASLADYLATRPGARVALVGHTDATGSLDANIAVSRRRAEAVRARLIETYRVTPAQISAEGAGWLTPRASNLTPEGRERNRRVEAVLVSLPN